METNPPHQADQLPKLTTKGVLATVRGGLVEWIWRGCGMEPAQGPPQQCIGYSEGGVEMRHNSIASANYASVPYCDQLESGGYLKSCQRG